ncbi:hypothetical protein KP509_05G027900 [Ceratopteris richardii]|uniref:DUF1995 domain-containing protein n=1 Tax=Ceratopteris richardii TaxID=49495 RepID=A0A8T2US48_CERRI|nr:hypothetical protein KP509_05G027900 [Ceratopteris richardii]
MASFTFSHLPSTASLLTSNRHSASGACLASANFSGVSLTGVASLLPVSSFIRFLALPSRDFRMHAKFQRFEQDEEEAESQAAILRAESNGTVFVVDQEQETSQTILDDKADDSVLPDDLVGAVLHSSESTTYYINSGGNRAIVELQLPELENLNEEGAQQRLWDLARLYLDSLQNDLKTQRLKAIFPDAGAAALLKHTWSDATFSFGSLNDRRPVSEDDEVVVLVVPDYQMLTEVQKIASQLSGDVDGVPRPLVMWNPRLFSGDVGIGLNVRRTRDNFVSTFTVVYSMRPLPQGAIFRRYPGLWQVFLDDKARPGRYLLAAEQPTRPLADDLDVLILEGQEEKESEEPSPFVKAMGVFASFNRFMRSLSK